MSGVGDTSTVVDDEITQEAPDHPEWTDVPTRREPRKDTLVGSFALSEIGRVNSVLGAVISDLELALKMTEGDAPGSDAEKTHQAIADAHDGCLILAKYQQIFSRLESMRNVSRYEASIVDSLDEAASQADLSGATMVRNYSKKEPGDWFDRQRMTQGVLWILQAIGAAVLDAKVSSRQRIISISFKMEEEGPQITIGQMMLPNEALEAAITSDLVSGWRIEAARIVLGWEGFSLTRVKSSEFAGFRATVHSNDDDAEREIRRYLT